MKISEISLSERPREKLLARGPATLGTAELLAILLRTGTPRANVLDIAHQLLSAADGSLLKLSALPRDALCAIPGIKKDKATTILAAFELGRRFLDEASWLPKEPVTTPERVYKIMIPLLKGLDHEECWVLFLNKAQRLIARERMTRGGSDATTIDVKDILRKSLDHGARGIVLIHNHPSDNPLPGQADIAMTKALQKAARSMDLFLLDHVIVCDSCYYSFTDDRMCTTPLKDNSARVLTEAETAL